MHFYDLLIFRSKLDEEDAQSKPEQSPANDSVDAENLKRRKKGLLRSQTHDSELEWQKEVKESVVKEHVFGNYLPFKMNLTEIVRIKQPKGWTVPIIVTTCCPTSYGLCGVKSRGGFFEQAFSKAKATPLEN